MRRRFEIGHCLGRGGFGEVYRAVAFSAGGLEQEVAIKLLHPDLLHNQSARNRMKDEGRMLSRLNHAAIVSCYALTVVAGRIALVTQYIPGADLSVCCRMKPPIPPRALLQAISEMGEALDLAFSSPTPSGEQMGLIHRDIKPGNIRIGQHGQPSLLDFGIARSDTMERNAQTAADLVVGSLLYMAPERFGAKGANSASDVFGLGCCLYEGLTSQPYYGTSSLRDISRLANEVGHYNRFLEQRLKDLPDVTPKALKDLIRDCLLHDANHRPTAAALGVECERLADQLGGVHLRVWARAQQWSENPGEPGPLTGRVLQEQPLPAPGETLAGLMPGVQLLEPSVTTQSPGTAVESPPKDTWTDDDGVLIPLVEAPAPPPPQPTRRAELPRIVGLSTSVLAVLTLLFGLAAFSTALYDRLNKAPAPIILSERDAPEKERKTQELPVKDRVVVEGSLPEVVETTPSALRRARPTKRKKASPADSPADVVPHTPVAQQPVFVKNGGAAAVELRNGGKRYPLPGTVPWGTYQIWGDFGAGLQQASSITVRPGDRATVSCLSGRKVCEFSIQ